MADVALPATPRILYIEDNPESRALVRSVLEPRGFDVLEASDGIAGIDLAISSHPDLILCDIQLPGIDGYETATRLRSYKGLDGCPIVVLTSHGDRGLSLSVGADGFIEKPIDVEKFPQQLREFLKGKREKLRGIEERRYLREYSQALVERLEATVRELTAANTRLRAAARSKNEFMQNLSHELATPLTPILGYLKILRSGKMGPLTDSQQKVIDSSHVAADRLSRTIDNLVDFATLEGGGQIIHAEQFSPSELVAPVIEDQRGKAKARRVHLLVSLEATEPGGGDVRKLRQALSNLIDNAIKFSPHGSEVLVRVTSEDGRLVFEVYDQGEGFLPNEAERVFEPFFHADRVGDERAPGVARDEVVDDLGSEPPARVVDVEADSQGRGGAARVVEIRGRAARPPAAVGLLGGRVEAQGNPADGVGTQLPGEERRRRGGVHSATHCHYRKHGRRF